MIGPPSTRLKRTRSSPSSLVRDDRDGGRKAFSLGTYSVHVRSESMWLFQAVFGAAKLTDWKGFVVDLDLDTTSLQIMRVSIFVPGITSVHKVTVNGVIEGE